MIDSLKHACKTAILQVTDNYIVKQQENIQIYLELSKGKKRKSNRILTKFSEIKLPITRIKSIFILNRQVKKYKYVF